jgi:hypothetical protein
MRTCVYPITRNLLAAALILLLAGSAIAQERGKKKLLALAGAVAFAIGAAAYDNHETLKGIRAGVGVEGNTWMVGSRPSMRALIGRDVLVIGWTSAPSVLAYKFHKMPFFYGGLGMPVIDGLKSIQGGKSWVALEH